MFISNFASRYIMPLQRVDAAAAPLAKYDMEHEHLMDSITVFNDLFTINSSVVVTYSEFMTVILLV